MDYGIREGGALKERRRERRDRFKLGMIVKGTDTSGCSFAEKTTLEDLSPNGAYFSLRNPVTRSASLSLLLAPGRPDLAIRASVVRLADGPEVKGGSFSSGSSVRPDFQICEWEKGGEYMK